MLLSSNKTSNKSEKSARTYLGAGSLLPEAIRYWDLYAAMLLEKKAYAFILKTPCNISHDTSSCETWAMRACRSGSIELANVVASVAQEPTAGADDKATAKGPDYFCIFPTIGDSHRGEMVLTYVEGILAVVEMLGRKKGRSSQWKEF